MAIPDEKYQISPTGRPAFPDGGGLKPPCPPCSAAPAEKIKVGKEMNALKTKTELCQILGFFSYFRDYIENFAGVAKLLTDLTAKQVQAIIPWKPIHQHAFDELKRLVAMQSYD